MKLGTLPITIIGRPSSEFPPPPPPPPTRIFRQGFFSYRETPESIRATEDWRTYMAGYQAGLEVGRWKKP